MKNRVNQGLFRWNRIIFTDLGPETDIFLYRQMCELLVPQKGSVNRFRIHGADSLTDFYVGSDDLLSLKFMKSFFSRLYPLKYEDVTEDIREPELYSLYRVTGVKEDGPIMVPSLLQNVAFIHNVAESEVLVDIALYRHKKDRVAITFRVGFNEKSPVMEKILRNIHLDVMKFSKKSGIKIKRIGRTGGYHLMRGIDPRFLINFVRVPVDEDV